MASIYDILSQLKIDYIKYDHPAVFTVEEASKYDRGIGAGKTKNLFLRNKKGDVHYLIIAEITRKIDLKILAGLLKENKLSFASQERLLQYLKLSPGSVSPFGLINDSSKTVITVIDRGLLKHKKLAFHPNINTATLAIKTEDFLKFLESTGNRIIKI